MTLATFLLARTEESNRLYERTNFTANMALKMSIEAYNEALTLFSDAQNLQLPGVNVQQLMKESNRIKEEVGSGDGSQLLEYCEIIYVSGRKIP